MSSTAETIDNPLASDVCDACHWQAYIEAYRDARSGVQYLTLCGHHGRKHTPALIAKGWTVVEHTQFIESGPA